MTTDGLLPGAIADADLLAAGYWVEDESSPLAGLRNGAWLDRQLFPPLRYHVPQLVPEGSALLVGAPKIGKSFLALGVGLGVAAGGVVLGQVKVEARPVLYLALEDGDRRLQERCRQLLAGEPIPEAFTYLTTLKSGPITTIEAWLALHGDEAPLVILDTLGKVMPPAKPGESSYQRDYRVGSALKRLVDSCPGSALLVNHHDRKASADDFVDAVSGTHGLAGAADTILVLCRARQEQDGVVKVTGRDVAEGEYAVRFDPDALWRLDGDGFDGAASKARQRQATAGVGDRMADVIDFVSDCSEPVGPGDVAAAIGVDPKTAQVYLQRAVKAGRLQKPRRGAYSPVGSVGLSGAQDLGTNKPTEPTPPTGTEDDCCTACDAEVERYDPDGKPWCAVHVSEVVA